MIEIVIKKNGIQTNGARFNSQQEADAWLEQEISKNSFGKNERWVTEEQEDISNALESRIIEIFPAQEEILDEELNIIQEARAAVTRTEYKLAAEYIIEQIDITDEINQQNINEESMKYLSDTDWYIIREMDEGTPCPPDIKTERAAARARIVK